MSTDRARRRDPESPASHAAATEEATHGDSDRSQLVERLHWKPKERLDYLVDMLAFEERARRARKL